MSKDEQIILMDISSIPDGWDGKMWFKFIKQQGIVFYDSYNNAQTPKVINAEKGKELHIVDYSTKEGKEIFDKLNKNKYDNK